MDQLIIEGKDIIYSKENPVSSYRLATPEERKVIALSYIRDLEEGDERFNISVATEDKKIDTERRDYNFRSMIIYEDEDFVCINKPPHLNVHP